MRGESLQDVLARVRDAHRAEFGHDDAVVFHGSFVGVASEESVHVGDFAVVEGKPVHQR